MSHSLYSRVMKGTDFPENPVRNFSIISNSDDWTGKKMTGFVDGIRWDYFAYNGRQITFHVHPWEHPIVFEFPLPDDFYLDGNEEIAIRYHLFFLLPQSVMAIGHTFEEPADRSSGSYTHVIRRVVSDDETDDFRWVECSIDGIPFRVDFKGGENQSPGEIYVPIQDWVGRREEVIQEIRMSNVHNQ